MSRPIRISKCSLQEANAMSCIFKKNKFMLIKLKEKKTKYLNLFVL